MNKHTIIVIIASIVIAGTVGFSFWNIYAAEQIQFRPVGQHFSFFEFIHEPKIAVCNPLPLYTSFSDVNLILFFEGKEKGVFNAQGLALEPNSITTIEGMFSSPEFEEMQYLSMHFDGMFTGSTPVRIDPKKLDIETEFTTQVLGAIPISVSNQYSGIEFWEMMNSDENQGC